MTLAPTEDAKIKALEAKTRAHYDAFPYDYVAPRDPVLVWESQFPPLRDFIETYVHQGTTVAEVGCGAGRATLFLTQKGAKAVALDISEKSAQLAKARAPEASVIVASAMAVPLPDKSFEVAFSDGVIHIIPSARKGFAEVARITRDGGHFFIAIYNPDGYYRLLYQYVGAVFRVLERNALGKAFLFSTAVPFYWLAHKIKSGGQRTWSGSVNLFYDYFITPHVMFHSRAEVIGWGEEVGVKLLNYEIRRNMHVFIFKKTGS